MRVWEDVTEGPQVCRQVHVCGGGGHALWLSQIS